MLRMPPQGLPTGAPGPMPGGGPAGPGGPISPADILAARGGGAAPGGQLTMMMGRPATAADIMAILKGVEAGRGPVPMGAPGPGGPPMGPQGAGMPPMGPPRPM